MSSTPSKRIEDVIARARIAYWLPAQRKIVNDLVDEVERLREELAKHDDKTPGRRQGDAAS